MIAGKIRYAVMMLAVALSLTACSDEDEVVIESVEGKYGVYTFGERLIPVNSYTVSDEDWFLVKLSPWEDGKNDTYVIIGVNATLLGESVDVERSFCNDDYIFVYESPTYYHAVFRPLQRGEIRIAVNEGNVSLKADVITYDGQVFKYENNTLAIE